MSPSHWRWLIGSLCLLGLAWLGVSRSYPLPTGPVAVTVTLPAGVAGQTSALVSTGQTGAGTLLYLRYVEPTTTVIGYDSWAVGGPVSEPIAFTPGVARPLVIDLPAFTAPPRVDRRARGPLRVTYDQRDILRAEVHYHGRADDELYFAANPIGGTITNAEFPGVLTAANGRILQGRPTALYSLGTRTRHWVATRPLQVGLAVVVSGLVAWLLPVLAGGAAALLRRASDPVYPGQSRPPHLAFAITSLACAGVFVAIVTGGTFRLFQAESFGQFYDYQIASLLAGRLDVPEAALSSESFRYAGKYYGYFGPTPALLRLPFALTGIGFGHLSRSYLLLYYLASLAAAYALLIHAARQLSGMAAWPTRTQVILLVGGVGLGSTLLFVASRAYIYHEAILCGAALALWGAWSCLCWLTEPTRHRWWLLALACGVLAVHARPPAGLFALACLGFSAAALLGRAWIARRRGAEAVRLSPGTTPPRPRFLAPMLAGFLAVLGVLSFNGLSYLKFRSFEGAPLRYHVQYHAERLANIGGANFHPGNFTFGFAAYAWHPNFELRPTFPYFYAQGRDPIDYPGSRIDLPENTLALPYSMPALTYLAVCGLGLALVRWPSSRLPVGILVAGVAPMAAALVTAIAISQRYTGDFVPFLVCTAAFGLCGLSSLPPLPRRLATILAGLLTVTAILITLALTLHYQGEGVWGVPDEVKANYLSLRQTMDQLLGFSRP